MRTFLRGFFFFFTAGFLVTVGFAELFTVGLALDLALDLALGFVVGFAELFAEGFALGFALAVALAVTFAEGFGVGFFVAASAFEPERARARIRESDATRDPI